MQMLYLPMDSQTQAKEVEDSMIAKDGENMLPKWITIKTSTQPFEAGRNMDHFESAKVADRKGAFVN